MATKKQKAAGRKAARVLKCLRKRYGKKRKFTIKQRAACGSKSAKAKKGSTRRRRRR